MKECKDGLMIESMVEWMDGGMKEWNEGMTKLNEGMQEWMDGWMDERME